MVGDEKIDLMCVVCCVLRSCVCDVGVGVRLRVVGAPIYIGTTMMYLLLIYYNSERRLHKRMANF